MAKKPTFPMLPGAHWWTLREKFKQSIPGVVTDSYLVVALNMQESSARGNVLPYLKDIGLIDDDNKTLELAKAWRDDAQYAAVCKQIREKIYPQELLSLAPDPTKDRAAIERWFGNSTGLGASAVRRMTQFYLILLEADVNKKSGAREGKASAAKKKTRKEVDGSPRRQTPANQKTVISRDKYIPPDTRDRGDSLGLPGVSINLQIHISADATPDQIDKIFESMAKHIYKK